MQEVFFEDLGKMDYQVAWDYQEKLLQRNISRKSEIRRQEYAFPTGVPEIIKGHFMDAGSRPTVNHFLLVEHPPVYTIGKSGHAGNILITEEEMKERGIGFFKTNRGGDITFHGPEQIVGYPILDLEKFYTDIGRYLRDLEEVIIRTIAEYGLNGDRLPGQTGVWLDPSVNGRERKICALGVRCSRWITMHGFAFNVNTDLTYFNNIVPCGIRDKQVTSMQKELGRPLSMHEIKEKVKRNFEEVFEVELTGNKGLMDYHDINS